MSSENWGGVRSGSGRPLELGESKLMSFDCPLDLIEELTKEAQIRGLSRADHIRSLLKKGLKHVQNITITADIIDIVPRRRDILQEGKSISFQAKEKAQFGPLGAWYYLLPDNTVLEHADPRALPGVPSSVRICQEPWQSLRKMHLKWKEWVS